MTAPERPVILRIPAPSPFSTAQGIVTLLKAALGDLDLDMRMGGPDTAFDLVLPEGVTVGQVTERLDEAAAVLDAEAGR